MKANLGSVDRTIRVVLGLALLPLPFTLEGGLRWMGLVGLTAFATAAARWCPAYALFGIGSYPLGRGAWQA